MQLSVTFKNIDPSDHLKAYLQEKLDRLDKLLDNPAEASAALSVQKHRHIAEINVNGDRLNIIGKEETNDLYSAIDMVMDKLEKQIKKGKEKIRDHRTAAKAKNMEMLSSGSAPEEDLAREIKMRYIDYKPMDVEEAAMQLDLTPDNFLVFTNARTALVNVVYRRNDGHLGLIQPSE